MRIFANIILTIIPIFFIFVTVKGISEQETNHVGGDILVMAFVFGLIAIYPAYKIIKEKKQLYKIGLIANLIAIGFAVYIDHFNILVEKGKWLERGMPDPYEKSSKIERDYPGEIDNRLLKSMAALEKGKITQEEFDKEVEKLSVEMHKAKEAFYEAKRKKSEEEQAKKAR